MTHLLTPENNTQMLTNLNVARVLYTNIDQTLVNSLHGLLNCEIGEYRTHVHCIHM